MEKHYDGDPFWSRTWYGLICVVVLVVLSTFQSYGVTSDEGSHVQYGRDIARWYASLFTDRSVFNTVNTWLYGGFFDFTTHLISLVSPFNIYETRHLSSALVGVLGLVAAYRIGCVLGGKRAGFLAALCLVLTPRYFGHAFNNTKDIPFAVFYLWGLYFLIQSLDTLPQVTRSVWVKLGVAIGLTMAIRANGAVLLVYMGLFWSLRLVQVSGGLAAFWGRRIWLRCLGVGALAYAVVFPFWPYLHLHPLTGLWDGIVMFASFSEVHYSFFEGQYVASNAIPWYYAPKWLLLTLPEFALGGMVFGLVWFVSVWREMGRDHVVVLQWAVLWFGGLFPLVYGVVSHTPLYDGLRQMLFVIPPLVVGSVVGFERCVSAITRAHVRWLAWGLNASLLLLTLWDMVMLHPNQYVYFNRAFAGGVSAAAPMYETDYWNHTYKQGLDWVSEHGARFVDDQQKPTVGSLYPNLETMLDASLVTLAEPEDADFYLGNTRYDLHKIIPGRVIHTIDAQGVPLLYVIQPDARYQSDPFFDGSPRMHDRVGNALRQAGHMQAALAAYETTLDRLKNGFVMVGLDSSGVLHKMGNVLLGLDRYEAALEMFDRIPDKVVLEGAIANNLGLYFLGKRDFEQAFYWLSRAVDVAPNFYEAHVSLGSLFMQFGDTTRAATLLQTIAERRTKDVEQQLNLGNLLYSLEQYEAASACFERMTQVVPDDARGYYYCGLAKSAGRDYVGARDAFLQAVIFDPEHSDAYQSLAAAYMHLEAYEDAIQAFERSIALVPDDGYLYTVMGIAQMNLGQFVAAKQAFHNALKIDPGDVQAQRHLHMLQSMVQ